MSQTKTYLMKYQNLDIKTRKGIAIVTINREKALNALNSQTMEELRHFFSVTALRRKKMKGVIITGAGTKAFVAGADIKEFSGLTHKTATAFAQRGHDTFSLIERFNKPVIAAVNGYALGGGCELAMACHMRVASENARFGQPEVNLGIIPGYGGTQRLIQYIGKGKALELIMTADMIGVEEAHRLGLVNHIVAQKDLITKAMFIIEKIATKAPIAIAKVVECTNAYFHETTDGFAVEVESFAECTLTEDFEEGAKAFVEKRKANFQGK